MKTAIIILADPKSGSEEATARVFNALALADEAKREGDEVEVTFIDTGTRWPAELSTLGHPANALYNRVRDTVKGASCGCAAVFGATGVVEECGLPLIKENPIPSTPVLASLRRYLAEGWKTMMF